MRGSMCDDPDSCSRIAAEHTYAPHTHTRDCDALLRDPTLSSLASPSETSTLPSSFTTPPHYHILHVLPHCTWHNHQHRLSSLCTRACGMVAAPPSLPSMSSSPTSTYLISALIPPNYPSPLHRCHPIFVLARKPSVCCVDGIFVTGILPRP